MRARNADAWELPINPCDHGVRTGELDREGRQETANKLEERR
jgi:hypothetical protein